MRNNKKQNKKSEIFWRIAISLVGIALILIAISNVLLFIFGETAIANVKTRRVGGADDGRPANARYEWSIDYSFEDLNGIVHNGHTTRRGGDMSVNIENKVYYFAFAPYINSLELDAKPNVGQPILIILGTFLIYVMNKKKKSKKVGAKYIALKKVNGEIDVPELADYDDAVEELFDVSNK